MQTPKHVDTILRGLQEIPSHESLFNQYLDSTEYDVAGAPSVRAENLHRYLSKQFESATTLILAEAPGPWGCRFTGIPITSEVQLASDDFPFDGKICTAGPPRKEYSAGIFWRVLRPYHSQFLVWNSVPFHPHKIGARDSIRPPTKTELLQFSIFTQLIVDLVEPTRILALGRRAEQQLSMLSLSATYIRHPSQGGATKFELGMLNAFSV